MHTHTGHLKAVEGQSLNVVIAVPETAFILI